MNSKVSLKASCKYRLVHYPNQQCFKLLEFRKNRLLNEGASIITIPEEQLIDILVEHYEEQY